MCRKYEIARNTVAGFIVNKEKFTYDELQRSILDNGGVFRISNTQSLDHFLNSYQQKGIIRYSPAEGTFTTLVDFSLEALKQKL